MLIWSIRLWRQSNSLAMIVLPLLLIGLSYNNLILSVGSLIGEGDLLKSLNILRYIAHYIVVPLLIVVVVELARRTGAGWASRLNLQIISLVAVGLCGFEVTNQLVGLELAPQTFAGILRYVSAHPSQIPDPVAILVNIFMLMISIGIWRRVEWPWLFVGALVCLISHAIPTSLVGTVLDDGSEVLLALSLLLTQWRTQFPSISWRENVSSTLQVL